MTIDGITYLNPDAVNGLNLYAYCLNNPVAYCDETGCFPWLALAIVGALLLFTPLGGTVTQAAVSTASYVGMAVASIGDEAIRKDMNDIKWNPLNSNEQLALDSSKVSFYKGVPVFRTDLERSGSFGAIFLRRGFTDEEGVYHIENNPDTVRHERGHNWQLMMMGVANYAFMIGLPSWQEWSERPYYERPWEITADLFGGVIARNHTQENIETGLWYLAVSTSMWLFGYSFLLGEYN